MDADEILVIENGTLLERGSHAELLSKRNSLYSRTWDIQHSTTGDFSEDNLIKEKKTKQA